MKKMIRIVCFLGLLVTILCVSAAAADGSSGIYDLRTETNVTVTPKTAADAEISSTSATINGAEVSGFYANAEKFTVTYNGASSSRFYLVVALSDGTGIPTSSNIAYIDQTTASSSSVTFTVYPNALVSGKTYTIYLSSNDGQMNTLTKAAEFKYYAPYTLGDVDESGSISAVDALYALRISVGDGTWSDNQKLAADADRSGSISAVDALWILEASVGNREL